MTETRQLFKISTWKLQIWEQQVFLRQKESENGRGGNNLLRNLKKSLSIWQRKWKQVFKKGEGKWAGNRGRGEGKITWAPDRSSCTELSWRPNSVALTRWLNVHTKYFTSSWRLNSAVNWSAHTCTPLLTMCKYMPHFNSTPFCSFSFKTYIRCARVHLRLDHADFSCTLPKQCTVVEELAFLKMVFVTDKSGLKIIHLYM